METWRAESQPGKQRLVSLLSLAVGLLLAWGFRHHAGDANASAGFWLGWLLLAIGSAGLIYSGRQTITIDPHRRLITVEDHLLTSTRIREIAFDDITDIGIGYLGKKSNFVTYYYLALTLRNGREYPLFQPGRFYAGGSERGVVEGWQKRLLSLLH